MRPWTFWVLVVGCAAAAVLLVDQGAFCVTDTFHRIELYCKVRLLGMELGASLFMWLAILTGAVLGGGLWYLLYRVDRRRRSKDPSGHRPAT